MSKNLVISVVLSVFISFSLLLSIKFTLSAKDEGSDMEWQQSDLESRIESLESDQSDLESALDNLEGQIYRVESAVEDIEQENVNSRVYEYENHSRRY